MVRLLRFVCDRRDIKTVFDKAPYQTRRTERLAPSLVRKGQDPMRGGRGNRVRACAFALSCKGRDRADQIGRRTGSSQKFSFPYAALPLFFRCGLIICSLTSLM